MTYKELPDYCGEHMCPAYSPSDKPDCEYQGLCTRFQRKLKTQKSPFYLKKQGLLPKELTK